MSCNCNNQPTNYNICNPAPCQEPQDCSCPTILKSDCVNYSGDDLECSNIKQGTILTELIQQLDAFICQVRDDLLNAFSLRNIGAGAKVYKGDDLLGRKELRTIESSTDIITVTEATNTIQIGIDEDELNQNINIVNVGEGIEVYKGYNGISNEHEFRTLTSTGNSVTITQGTDAINLEVDIEPAIICLTSTNKTVTITEVEDCFDLSVNLPTSVNVGTGEDVYKTFNLFTNQNEFKTLKSNNSTIGLSPSIDELSLEVNNLQKTINTFPYELTSDDNQHTLFVTNGLSNVEIRVPNTLTNNFTCVIIQEGVGSVTITGIGTSTINKPSGLTNVIKGQYHWAMLEKKGASSSYYLGGSLTAIV